MKISRHPYLLPVLAGTVAILFTVAVLVGWSIIFTRFYIVATEARVADLGVGYWVLLSLGCLFLVGVTAVLVLLLVSQVRRTMQVRQQTAFIDSVSHELRAPLASLTLALDTLETRELTAAERARFHAGMRRDLQRLASFIESILEAGRLDQGARRLVREPVDLPALLEGCRQGVAARHGVDPAVIAVTLEGLDGPAAEAITDRMALATVVENLLDNAIKYSDGRPEVRLAAAREGERLRIAVSDQGQGIPRSQLGRVFARFHRVERRGPHERPGTGLGLYVVSALVRRLGGRIAARSGGEGKGADFELWIPLGDEAAVAAGPAGSRADGAVT